MIGLRSPPENTVAGLVKGGGISRSCRSSSTGHGEGHAGTECWGLGTKDAAHGDGRASQQAGGQTTGCPCARQPAATDILN